MNHKPRLRVVAALFLLLALLVASGGAPVVAQGDAAPGGAAGLPAPAEPPLTVDGAGLVPAALGPDATPDVSPQAGESWWDGAIQYTAVINYLGYAEYGYGTWVGYWQNVDAGHPLVNELYLVKVSVYGVGSPASGLMSAVINFALPPSTVIDTASYPARCFGGAELAYEITVGCPQAFPYSASTGTYNIPSGDAGNMWPVSAGAGWEFWIPVRTSAPLSGSNFTGHIDNIEAMNEPDWLYPTVPVWVFAGSAPPPGAFNKTAPANGAAGVSASPTLSWGSSTGAARYEVCVDTSNDNACSSWVNNGTATSRTFAGAPGTTYYWQVRAVNDGGTTYANGSSTAYWSFTTAVPATAPGAFNKTSPANGAVDQQTSLTLYWGASSGATRYEYCYDTSNDNACSSWVNNGTATSKALSGLATATTYYWQARAVNDVGTTYANGSSTAYWSFSTAAPVAPPGAFGRLFPANGAVDQQTSLTLYWGASSGATSYQYCLDTTNDSACSTSWISTGTATSVSLSGLTLGTRYYWHARAINGTGTTYADGYSAIYWTFDTETVTSADNIIVAMAVQPDGKVLLGGYFTQVNGVTRNRIARLNADSSLDTSFNPNIAGVRVDAIVVQPDGKILVSGDFTSVGGVSRNRIARLNANGTLDTAFNPNANGAVYTMALLTDGKILAGGAFTSIAGGSRNRIALLQSNGTLDPSFELNADDIVQAIGLLPDNRILIGGFFKYLNDQAGHAYLARLWWNGTVDDDFHPELDGGVQTLARQPDGQILIGGRFTTVNGVAQGRIARLDPDGNLDSKGFNASANDDVLSFAVQSDGKILVCGAFTVVNGVTHNRIVRLDEKGGVDTSLALDANGVVNAAALQADGKLLLGGAFSQFNAQAHSRIARIPNNTTATQTLWAGPAGPTGDWITWSPRLALPAFQRVTFELSTNGTGYTIVGDAFYSGGNWQKGYLSLPKGQDIWIRARGYVDTGRFNGSGSIMETVATFRLAPVYRVYLPLVIR